VYPLDNWTFNRTLSRMAEHIKADVYEAHTASGYGFQRKLKNRKISVPFVQTVHGVLADEAEQQQKQGIKSARDKIANYLMKHLAQLEKEAAKNATIVVTISKYSQKRIEELYEIDSDKIRIVPNGVDPERFKQSNKCEQFKKEIGADKRQVVLFVGRLIPRKGLNYLIKAASRVVSEFGKTLFVIVGNGPLKAQLISEVEKLGLAQNFAFLGDLPEEKLPTVYSCSDVFAFPSIQEGQGIAALEAQASNVPVVGFRVSGVAEAILEGETGLLSDPDGDSLAEGILRLLADNTLRKKMGTKGRLFVQTRYTWDICAQRMKSVYYEALRMSQE
jgi:glycogen(starch) synthase